MLHIIDFDIKSSIFLIYKSKIYIFNYSKKEKDYIANLINYIYLLLKIKFYTKNIIF